MVPAPGHLPQTRTVGRHHPDLAPTLPAFEVVPGDRKRHLFAIGTGDRRADKCGAIVVRDFEGALVLARVHEQRHGQEQGCRHNRFRCGSNHEHLPETATSYCTTGKPQRHGDTKTSQSTLDRPARSRPPGGRTAGRGHRSGHKCPSQSPRPSGPRSRRARASPLSLIRSSRSSWHCCGGTDALQARRPGESPTETDACVRSGRAFHRVPAIIGSPAFPPFHSGRLRRRRYRSFVSFVSSWLRRSFALCPLCLCGLVRVGIV